MSKIDYDKEGPLSVIRTKARYIEKLSALMIRERKVLSKLEANIKRCQEAIDNYKLRDGVHHLLLNTATKEILEEIENYEPYEKDN